MFKNILVPTDGSELSRHAAEKAAAFAHEVGARITALYVKPDLISFFAGAEDMVVDNEPSAEKLASFADRKAKKFLQAIRDISNSQGVECDTVTVNSEAPYKAIIDTAEKSGCDLVVMASHGSKGLSGVFVGSQTQKVLACSKIPVLVYR